MAGQSCPLQNTKTNKISTNKRERKLYQRGCKAIKFKTTSVSCAQIADLYTGANGSVLRWRVLPTSYVTVLFKLVVIMLGMCQWGVQCVKMWSHEGGRDWMFDGDHKAWSDLSEAEVTLKWHLTKERYLFGRLSGCRLMSHELQIGYPTTEIFIFPLSRLNRIMCIEKKYVILARIGSLQLKNNKQGISATKAWIENQCRWEESWWMDQME